MDIRRRLDAGASSPAGWRSTRARPLPGGSRPCSLRAARAGARWTCPRCRCAGSGSPAVSPAPTGGTVRLAGDLAATTGEADQRLRGLLRRSTRSPSAPQSPRPADAEPIRQAELDLLHAASTWPRPSPGCGPTPATATCADPCRPGRRRCRPGRRRRHPGSRGAGHRQHVRRARQGIPGLQGPGMRPGWRSPGQLAAGVRRR